jgi:uncharacterized protein with PIN domain
MKFIADVMLGRLAKRLRLRGIDVLYDDRFDDNSIIRISLQQNRVILTRDNGLASYPVEAHPLTRCSECNKTLTPIDKSEARDLVATYVYETNNAFLRCEACGRIYWKGTHVDRMESTGMI